MKVLRVVTLASASGKYGGPFDTAQEQCSGLAARGVDVVLVAGTLKGDRPLNSSAITEYVRPTIPRTRFASLMGYRFLKLLWQQIAMADTVHVSFTRESIPIMSAMLTIAARKKLVLQTHGMLLSRKSLSIRVFDKIFVIPILKRSNLVLALTDTEAKHLRIFGDFLNKKIRLLGNPIRREFLGDIANTSGEEVDALFLGRLHPRKNPVVFAQAARISAELGESISYRITGPDDGELTKVRALLKFAPNLDCRSGIPASEVPTAVSSCRVFVMPSYDEPWGNVLVGALALGKPVIVTESSALASEIARSGAGITVADDDADQIRRAILKIVNCEGVHHDMSTRAIELDHDVAAPDRLHDKLTHYLTQIANEFNV